MGNSLLLIGGGGHCHSVLDSVIANGLYERIGIVDHNVGNSILGISVVGDDNDLNKLIVDGWSDAFITVGSVGETKIRRRLYEMISQYGFNIPIIIDNSAIVGNGVTINEGVFVGKNAVVNSGSSVGICSIINTGAIVEHDCNISDFCHISSGATLCGGVKIGHNSHVGAGSVVIQSVEIGSDVMVGAGSVVVKNINDGVKAYGNPCKVV